MSQSNDQSQEDTISVADMRSALNREIQEIMKAAELRIREFSRFTQAYTAGEITPAEATAAFHFHQDKWGDTLPGVNRSIDNATDAEITADMDKAAIPYSRRVLTEKQSSQGTRKL